MAKDSTFEKILIHIWAELAAGLVIVTMGYFALNPESGIGVGLSLLGCLACVGILVYLFQDKIFSKGSNEETSTSTTAPLTPPQTPSLPQTPLPTPQTPSAPASTSTFDDDEVKKPDSLKAHYGL
jgi:drug/metabolite transporter (DMT)-like permease